jgi:hypothetical protein
MRRAVKNGFAFGMKSRQVAASTQANTKLMPNFSSNSNPTGEAPSARTLGQLFLADSTYEEQSRILKEHDSPRWFHIN